MIDVTWAKDQAERLVGSQHRRWSHVQAVAGRADELATAIFAANRQEHEVVVMAAWLHDVGYAEDLVRTGCHHLDGAIYVRGLGEERLAGLVAYHSSGAAEASLRGLAGETASFDQEASLVADLLTYCDLSTGPGGSAVTLDERLAEVADRYGEDHVVTRGLRASEDALRASFSRIEGLVAVTSWSDGEPSTQAPRPTPKTSRSSVRGSPR